MAQSTRNYVGTSDLSGKKRISPANRSPIAGHNVRRCITYQLMSIYSIKCEENMFNFEVDWSN